MLVREVEHLGVATALEVVALVTKGETVWVKDGQDVLAVDHAEISADNSEVSIEGLWLQREWGYEAQGAFHYVYPAREVLSLVKVTEREARHWQECLPYEYQTGKVAWDEEVVWQAIADFSDLDVSEIADGDITEYL
jgi:hypothetical protein